MFFDSDAKGDSKMANEKTHGEKAVAALSMGLLAVSVFVLIVGGAGTIATRGHFAAVFKETAIELPLVTRWITSIPDNACAIFFVSLIAALILKELLIRSRKLTLTSNIVAAVAAMAYVLVYVVAMILPVV